MSSVMQPLLTEPLMTQSLVHSLKGFVKISDISKTTNQSLGSLPQCPVTVLQIGYTGTTCQGKSFLALDVGKESYVY